MHSTPIVALALSAATFVAAGPANIGARIPSKVRREPASNSGSSSLPTITTKGNAFFQGSDRFYIRGIDYQPGGSSQIVDPLADYSTCSRDIANFKKLGLNTIRVYTVDNSANHDQCMSALADAGIYLALDVNSPLYSLNRNDPGPSYNPTYLQSVFATIDAFAGYTNTLLFFSGNEVINAANSTVAAPYIKAVNRDMKQYIGERAYRAIPVGYSAADVSENQFAMGQYMACGSEPQMRSDFYAINNYEWCDPSSFTTSGWDQLVAMYSNYSTPLFFSEYGCITNTRTFAETTGLYQPDMTKVFSGGLVYEYSEEGNGYGIVNINGNTVTPIGQQFTDLQKALAGVSNPSNGGGYSTNGVVADCPAQSANWNTEPFTGDALPAMPSGAAQYMQNGAGKGPGLTGDGSQNAPGGSTATAAAGAGAITATYGPGATGSGAAGPLGPADFRPLMCGAIVFVCMMLGASIL